MPPILSVILLADMKQKYCTWYKTTSTSHSNCHLGYKEALLNPEGLDQKSAEYADLDAAHTKLWQTHHLMLYYTGWKNVVLPL